jgi:hypothetical protein
VTAARDVRGDQLFGHLIHRDDDAGRGQRRGRA